MQHCLVKVCSAIRQLITQNHMLLKKHYQISGLAGRRLPGMQEIMVSNSTDGKIWFSHFTLFQSEMIRIVL